MATPSPELNVNLADPGDVQRKLPRAMEILAQKEAAYIEEERRMQEALEPLATARDTWRQLVTSLKILAGDKEEDDGRAAEDVPASSRNPQDLVVEVVGREVRPIRARDVRDILLREGHELSGDSVSNALWYAAFKKEPPLIRQIKRGWYAPLAYKVDELAVEAQTGGQP